MSSITQVLFLVLLMISECNQAHIQLKHPEIISEIELPKGYARTDINGFGNYLRSLSLKPEGSLVKYYNGSEKSKDNVYEYVIDLEIGNKDLHQCADAIMRLRAEYFWEKKDYENIHFNFTNGFRVDYKEWMKGNRIVVDGNKTSWAKKAEASSSYKDFWDYMEVIFMYAGTASLEKEMKAISVQEAEIGDVLIKGGFPGHAVIIVDEAINKKGQKVFLLAQSYMPAQELQVLSNPFNKHLSPWYKLEEGIIKTSEWTFSSDQLKRF